MQSIDTTKKDTSLPAIRLRPEPTRLPTFAGANTEIVPVPISLPPGCRHRGRPDRWRVTLEWRLRGAESFASLRTAPPARRPVHVAKKRRLRHRRAARTSVSHELQKL